MTTRVNFDQKRLKSSLIPKILTRKKPRNKKKHPTDEEIRKKKKKIETKVYAKDLTAGSGNDMSIRLLSQCGCRQW